MAVALFPGAFKPPTKGHFLAVKELATNTFKAAKFSTDAQNKPIIGTLRSGKAKDKVDKVLVIISNKPRNGISSNDSLKIWNIYKKYLPSNIEIMISPDADPVRTALKLVKDNPDTNYLSAVYLRTDRDFADLSRTKSFDKLPNAKGIALKSDLEDVRATDLRNAAITNSFMLFKTFIPEELSQVEAEFVYDIVKKTVKVENKIFEELGLLLENKNIFTFEASSGTPIKSMSAIPASDRQKLLNVYQRIVDTQGDNFYDIDFNGDHVRVSLKDEDSKIGFDYTPYMSSILEYMLDNKMKIVPLPEIVIKKDPKAATDFFGKTAFYNNDKKEVTIMVMGRHPKDVMRSFVHEMIHHMQNLEGRLSNISTSNVNEDDDLVELEKEAYMVGNMVFRSWEDLIKNG